MCNYNILSTLDIHYCGSYRECLCDPQKYSVSCIGHKVLTIPELSSSWRRTVKSIKFRHTGLTQLNGLTSKLWPALEKIILEKNPYISCDREVKELYSEFQDHVNIFTDCNDMRSNSEFVTEELNQEISTVPSIDSSHRDTDLNFGQEESGILIPGKDRDVQNARNVTITDQNQNITNIKSNHWKINKTALIGISVSFTVLGIFVLACISRIIYVKVKRSRMVDAMRREIELRGMSYNPTFVDVGLESE